MNSFENEISMWYLRVLFDISMLNMSFGLHGPFQETNNVFVLIG